MTGTNNYYPFGLNHIGGGNISPFFNYHSYKFGSKELQETGMYDFGARMYMPDLGRWGVIDPLAETMRRYSPYNYAFNNPISFIDPDGRKPRQFAMPTDARPDAPSGWINPNWLGRGDAAFGSIDTGYGGSYGFGSLYPQSNGTDDNDLLNDIISIWEKKLGKKIERNKNGDFYWWKDYKDPDPKVKGVGELNILKVFNNSLMGMVNNVEGMSKNLMHYQTEDFFKDTEKHLNGQLGNANIVIDEYNKLSNVNKINASTFLSAVSGIRAGKILRSTEGFMKSVGKISKRLGYVGTALTAGVTLYEFGTDTWDAHSIINLGLLGATAVATFVTAPAIVAAAPAILAGIAIYGVADYMFGIGDQLDESIGRKSTIWYP
ncbi:RHS repeat-associated core domain-containing protein [Chryseobacterium indologenes]|uniref:RHS repeat-associated core domain-containing protein n=1 Tax=Chryseobacterium indologenes TaxID=253 RepID=UPI00102FE269|nr:RHS repeat-associated core domain-containing protein [Chryseobacterium indologenes]